MSNRRKYDQDYDLQLRLLEVTEDPTYGKSKHQKFCDVILVDDAAIQSTDPSPGVNKVLH